MFRMKIVGGGVTSVDDIDGRRLDIAASSQAISILSLLNI
jgi:hypothetical protein